MLFYVEYDCTVVFLFRAVVFGGGGGGGEGVLCSKQVVISAFCDLFIGV